MLPPLKVALIVPSAALVNVDVLSPQSDMVWFSLPVTLNVAWFTSWAPPQSWIVRSLPSFHDAQVTVPRLCSAAALRRPPAYQVNVAPASMRSRALPAYSPHSTPPLVTASCPWPFSRPERFRVRTVHCEPPVNVRVDPPSMLRVPRLDTPTIERLVLPPTVMVEPGRPHTTSDGAGTPAGVHCPATLQSTFPLAYLVQSSAMSKTSSVIVTSP